MQLGRRSADRCDVFPLALGVEAIHLNRLSSVLVMLCAAIGIPISYEYVFSGPRFTPYPIWQSRAAHAVLLRHKHTFIPMICEIFSVATTNIRYFS
jgi:hypothetical protein